MSCSGFSASDKHDVIRDIAVLVTEAVIGFRNKGHRNEYAIEQAALALEMTPRRVKSFVYGEVFAATVEEYQRIRGRFLAHLDAQADELAARSAAARARRAQMEMEL